VESCGIQPATVGAPGTEKSTEPRGDTTHGPRGEEQRPPDRVVDRVARELDRAKEEPLYSKSLPRWAPLVYIPLYPAFGLLFHVVDVAAITVIGGAVLLCASYMVTTSFWDPALFVLDTAVAQYYQLQASKTLDLAKEVMQIFAFGGP